MSDFFRGIIAGAIIVMVFFAVFFSFKYFMNRDRKIIEQWERQNEIQTLREVYSNRDPYEFFNDTPGVRRAADNATSEFRERRDEAVQRFRSRPVD